MGACLLREPAVLFLLANTARQLVGISVGIGSNRRRKLLQIQMVIELDGYRPGAPAFLSYIDLVSFLRCSVPLGLNRPGQRDNSVHLQCRGDPTACLMSKPLLICAAGIRRNLPTASPTE